MKKAANMKQEIKDVQDVQGHFFFLFTQKQKGFLCSVKHLNLLYNP